MNIKAYKNGETSVRCAIQFDGCEPEFVNRQEQRAVIHAAVLTREPVTTWSYGGCDPGKTAYKPGSETSKNVAKHISKNGISDRAKRLAEEMECCHIDALTDELPMEFCINRESFEEEEPHVEVDGTIFIYPLYSGVALGRINRFTYDLICSHTGQFIEQKKDRMEAVVAAATLAFEYNAKCKLGIMANYSDVPESRGF